MGRVIQYRQGSSGSPTTFFVTTRSTETAGGSPRFRIRPKVIISWAINDTTPGIPKMERREVG
jgi:hypothetical protein